MLLADWSTVAQELLFCLHVHADMQQQLRLYNFKTYSNSILLTGTTQECL